MELHKSAEYSSSNGPRHASGASGGAPSACSPKDTTRHGEHAHEHPITVAALRHGCANATIIPHCSASSTYRPVCFRRFYASIHQKPRASRVRAVPVTGVIIESESDPRPISTTAGADKFGYLNVGAAPCAFETGAVHTSECRNPRACPCQRCMTGARGCDVQGSATRCGR